MLKYLANRFVLSPRGAKDLIKGALYSALVDLSFMFPVGMGVYFLYRLMDDTAYRPRIGLYILCAVLILLVLFLVNRLQYESLYVATYNESAKRRISLAERLRKLPLNYFGRHDLSDLTSTIMKDCADLETAFSHAIPQLIGSSAALILVSIPLFILDWRMALSLLWAAPVSVLLIIAMKGYDKKGEKKHYLSKRAVSDKIQEGIETVEEIRSCNAEKRYLDELGGMLYKTEKLHIKAELALSAMVKGAEIVLKAGWATMLFTGTFLLVHESTDLFTFLVFLLVSSRIFDPIAGIFSHIAHVLHVDAPIQRMKEIYLQALQKGREDYEIKNFDISFKEVTFSYEDGKKVLDKVSFDAKQGKVTALIGPSGSGKSTIARLSARFWDVDSGSITIGNVDVREMDPEFLLRYFAIVFQDVTLFNTSIKENIRIGRKNARDEEVMEAARIAGCDEFVRYMPEAYDTVIGENGSTLSGGERQRISIARAILKDAPIILLDEASASLDVENETKIQSAISSLVADKTVVVIAHRMRTVSEADKIVALENGKVVETGSPGELMMQDGLYRRLSDLYFARE